MFWLIVSGLCSLGACIQSYITIHYHLKYYNAPELQRSIVRILFIVPVYAIASWLSFAFPWNALYFDTIRDCYEAYVIYCFLALMLTYGGGDSNLVAAISKKQMIDHPFPLCCLQPLQLNGKFLRLCKQGTLQFVIQKPITGILSIIMHSIGQYDNPTYRIFLSIVYNISYSTALYALVLFYLAAKEHLSRFNPVRKFLAVKVVIFMTFWQMLLIRALPGFTDEENNLINDVILCIEMLIFSFVHAKAFPYKEFMTGIPDTAVLQNVTDILSVRDVVDDAFHNFMPTYQDYVLHKPFEGADNKTYKATTYIIGNIDNVGIDEEMGTMIRNAEAGEGSDDDDMISVRLETTSKGGYGVTAGSKALHKLKSINTKKQIQLESEMQSIRSSSSSISNSSAAESENYTFTDKYEGKSKETFEFEEIFPTGGASTGDGRDAIITPSDDDENPNKSLL